MFSGNRHFPVLAVDPTVSLVYSRVGRKTWCVNNHNTRWLWITWDITCTLTYEMWRDMTHDMLCDMAYDMWYDMTWHDMSHHKCMWLTLSFINWLNCGCHVKWNDLTVGMRHEYMTCDMDTRGPQNAPTFELRLVALSSLVIWVENEAQGVPGLNEHPKWLHPFQLWNF